jgi:hypothetical protein
MLIPGIVLAISEQKETLAIIGSILAVISMVSFMFMVLRFGVGDQAKAEK